ncbi:MAG: DUF2330 domain-containing protein [Pseudomonadota bacterium]
MRRWIAQSLAAAALTTLSIAAAPAQAFCGFYVAKADGALFNEASKVVMMRDGRRTVITMANDYQGEAKDFAMVIPTPVSLSREQINVAESALIDHLDAYTAPRLVEYYDPDPCGLIAQQRRLSTMQNTLSAGAADAFREKARTLGVEIEAEYTVGEYDIFILSAKESGGLQTWLNANGYRTPDGAAPVLASYIAQGMKFFVAKVNLAEQAKRGGQFLRPLQIAFESDKFMLPIRLGTVNAKGKQDLLLFTLTRSGRVETANYPTRRIPSDLDIPLYVQERFGAFYKAMFDTAVTRAGGRAVFTEYAWDMAWCDPCAADPLSARQLRKLGVFWVKERATPRPPIGGTRRQSGAQDVFVTRLHVRYDAATFPEDLRLMETGDRRNFQGRYVTRHPFAGQSECPAREEYLKAKARAHERQAQTLATLTGWDITEIRETMRASGQATTGAGGLEGQPEWWREIWNDG